MAGLPLYIRLFGPVCVRCGEQEITRFGTVKNAELFAYLAYYPGAHSRSKIAELLWPEQQEGTARKNLSQAVYVLKKLLAHHSIPGDHLIIYPDTLQIDPQGFTTDVAAFEAALRAAKAVKTDALQAQRHLQRAVRLAASEFLEGCDSEWANNARNVLAARLDEALSASGYSEASDIFSGDEAADQEEPIYAEATTSLYVSGVRTRFFGRTEEIHAMCELMRTTEARIVTLTGMAGVGKTRLAIQSAQQMADSFGQEIHFVPLADVLDARQIATRIPHTLGYYESDSLPPLQRLVAHLQGRAALLILDNFEQLAGSGTALLGMLLNQLPALKLLVTSRQTLHVSGEREFYVQPLPFPAASAPLRTLLEYPSIELFQDRMQQKRFTFQVTQANAPTIIQICRKLEGIPLAIELAAAHGRDKNPAMILEGLNRRFERPISAQPETDARHRSLQAALEWSCEALTPELRQFFTQLSVFRNGWTADAAEAVCKVSQAPMFLNYFLEPLLARSLIVLDESSEEMRYRMLETIREFGNAQLTTEERSALADAHAHYFVHFARTACSQMTGADQKEWISRIERERSNLHAALILTLQGATPELAYDLINTLAQFWFERGYYSKGQALIVDLMPNVTHPDTRARMLNVSGVMALQQGDYAGAKVSFEECLQLAQVADNLGAQSNAQGNLGLLAWNQGNYEESRILLGKILQLDITLGKPRNIIITRLNLSNVLQAQNDISGARQLNTENLELARKEEDAHAMAWSFGNLGQLARIEGDLTEALALYRTSLAILRDKKDDLGMATMLEEIAYVLQVQGHNENALRLLGTATATRKTLQAPLAPVEQPTYDACLVAAHNALSSRTGKRLLAEGHRIPLAAAVASLLENEYRPAVEQKT